MSRPRLLQEILIEQDPTGWRLCVGCVLLNVTTRTQADLAWPELFRRWPTPERMARARVATISSVLHPLGCSTRRAATLRTLSEQWMERPPRDADDVPRLYGLGEYARDSWFIFKDGGRDAEPTDRVLAAWLAGWRAGGGARVSD